MLNEKYSGMIAVGDIFTDRLKNADKPLKGAENY